MAQLTSFAARTRSEQRHLLVELELDDSVVLSRSRRSHEERNARRSSAFDIPGTAADPNYAQYARDIEDDLEFRPAIHGSNRARPQSAKTRVHAPHDNGAQPVQVLAGGYPDRLQQHHNSQNKLLSPYKLKQKVLSSRQQPSPERESRHRATRSPTTASRDSPFSLLVTSFRKNVQLRDQLVTQLHQELSDADVRTNRSRPDRHTQPMQLPPRIVKLLNELRSLSLAIVEMQMYFQRDLLTTSTESGASVAIMEREMLEYLLQMSASDVDFLSCYTPLLRHFDRNDISIARNPFVEGLSMDSSELLLCSCNHLSPSALPASSSHSTSSTSSLFQLLIHKLEDFARYMNEYLPMWQVLPHSRVAVAMLHLAELETRANASRLLPTYLRSPEVSMPTAAQARERTHDVRFPSSTLNTYHEQPARSNIHFGADPTMDKPWQSSESPRGRPRPSFVAWDAENDSPYQAEAMSVPKQAFKESTNKLPSVELISQPSSPSLQAAQIDQLAQPEPKIEAKAKQPLKKRKGTAIANEPVSTITAQEKAASNYISGSSNTVAETSIRETNKRSMVAKAPALQHIRSTDNSVEAVTKEPAAQLNDLTAIESTAESSYFTKQDAFAAAGSIFDDEEVSTTGTADSSGLLPTKAFQRSRQVLSSQLTHDKIDKRDTRAHIKVPPALGSPIASESIDDIPPVGLPACVMKREHEQASSKVTLPYQSVENEPEDGPIEYSSDDTLSMIASALDLLPSLGDLSLGSSRYSETCEHKDLMLPHSASVSESVAEVDVATESSTTLSRGTMPSILDALSKNVSALQESPKSAHASSSSATDSRGECALEKIYSLCRDVQVAALDMTHYFDNNAIIESREFSSPECARPHPSYSLSESPRYLERELKMLRRYFRPWRDFAFSQTEAKQRLRDRAAGRLVLRFMQSSHQACAVIRIERELAQQHVAAERIQRFWRAHRQRARFVFRKAEFKVVHMAFKRYCLFVRLNGRHRRREDAKERIHRWWRRCRDDKRKQEAERVRQHLLNQRRSRAARDVQRFLREAVLRQRLARIIAENQQMQFKAQLVTLKTRQEDEKRRRIENRRWRSQEYRTKHALGELEAKWKRSEHEKLQLKDHHERVVGQYERVDTKQRQQLARLKITTFIDMCLLQRKIKLTDADRERNEKQWRLVSLEKQALEREAGQSRASDKLQLRVLHKKLDKLEKEKTAICQAQEVLMKTQLQLREHLARTTIKSFVDVRVAESKADREKQGLLWTQSQLTAEKNEHMQMASEEITERERRSQAELDALACLLNKAQQDAAGLAIQHEQLRIKKQQDDEAMTKRIESALAEKSRIIISKWLSQQIRASREKVKWEKSKAEFIQKLESEKQLRLETERERQLLLIKREKEQREYQVKANLALLQRRKARMKSQQISDKRRREEAKSTICSFVSRRVQSSRRLRAAEQNQLQIQELQERERELAQRLREFLIEAVIDTKCIAERLVSVSIGSAVASLRRMQIALDRRQSILQHLRRNALARKIQYCWRSWKREQNLRMQEQGQMLLEELQLRSKLDLERRRKVEYRLHRRSSARKIQRTWRKRRNDKRAADQRQRERTEQLESICRRSSARKIQRTWRKRRNDKRAAERREIAVMLANNVIDLETTRIVRADALLRHVCARKIQQWWRRWRQSYQRTNEISDELDRIYRRSCGRRILKRWREWRKKCADLRMISSAIAIETAWRGYFTRQRFTRLKACRQHEDFRLCELRLSGLARKIQRCWGQWLKRVIQAKRAAVKHAEDDLIDAAKRGSRKSLQQRLRTAAAVTIQSHWAGYRCRLLFVRLRRQLLESLLVDCEAIRSSRESRLSQVARLGFRLELQRWACHELPSILSKGVNVATRRDHSARVVQRAYVEYCNRRQLQFRLIRRRDGANNHQIRVFFSGGRAWMTSNAHRKVRLRFSALMTRKLLQMLEPGAHTTLELQEAFEGIAVEAQRVFDATTPLASGDRSEWQDVGVDEMDLPCFGELTRKMGRVRSMYKRSFLEHGSLDTREVSKPFTSHPEVNVSTQLTIFDAVASASVEDAQFLLSQGADFAARQTSTGRTALHLLAYSSESYRFRLEMLEFLVHKVHADVNALDDLHETPLMLFAACGHLELAKTLLRYGADMSLTNVKGQNVLHRACEQDQVEVCGYLSSSAMRKGQSLDDRVGYFLHHADASGRFPLHVAAEKGFVECAKQFLRADDEQTQHLLCHRDLNGRTPLHAAIVAGHFEMVMLLLSSTLDRDLNAYDNLRCSPAHLAVDGANAVRVVSLLSSRGANMNAVDERGDTPLHWAALSGRLQVMQQLLEGGADPSLLNGDWETPVQLAAAYGHFDYARLLLNAQKLARSDDDSILCLEAELDQQQASGKSYYYKAPSPTASMIHASSSLKQTGKIEYWEELHQEVQLVEESGNFSSEDEACRGVDDDEEDIDAY